MAGTKVKVKVTQGKSTVSPPRDYFFLIFTAFIKFSGGVNIRRVGNISDFRPKSPSPFISETVRDGPMVTMDHY